MKPRQIKSLNDVRDLIEHREGNVLKVYRCPNGYLTCGIGHKLTAGTPITPTISREFFWIDTKKALENYEKLRLRSLDLVRKAVILDMLFQMGLGGVWGFVNMLAAIRAGDWEAAAKELLDSKYSREDLAQSSRDEENAEMLRTGEYRGH